MRKSSSCGVWHKLATTNAKKRAAIYTGVILTHEYRIHQTEFLNELRQFTGYTAMAACHG